MKQRALIYCCKAKPNLFPMKENKPFKLNSKCSHYGSLNGEKDIELRRKVLKGMCE